MSLQLDADVDEETLDMSAGVSRKSVSGHKVTRVDFGDLPLYYAETSLCWKTAQPIS